jgi:hypothetical protein
MTTKLKQVLAFDSAYMLAIAIAVWLPCLFIYGLHLSRPHFVAQTLLYGTGYMLLIRALTAFYLMYLGYGKEEK